MLLATLLQKNQTSRNGKRNDVIKKVFAGLSVFMAAFSLLLAPNFICEAGNVTYENNWISPGEDGSYLVSFTYENEEPYAGSEFCVSCSEGVSVKEVSYDTKVSSVGPKEARGYTWFGYYGSGNEFEEPVTISVVLEVDEGQITNVQEETPHIILASAKVHSVADEEYVTNDILLDKLFYLVQVDEGGNVIPPVEEKMDESTTSRDWIYLVVLTVLVSFMSVVFIYKKQLRRKRRKEESYEQKEGFKILVGTDGISNHDDRSDTTNERIC